MHQYIVVPHTVRVGVAVLVSIIPIVLWQLLNGTSDNAMVCRSVWFPPGTWWAPVFDVFVGGNCLFIGLNDINDPISPQSNLKSVENGNEQFVSCHQPPTAHFMRVAISFIGFFFHPSLNCFFCFYCLMSDFWFSLFLIVT